MNAAAFNDQVNRVMAPLLVAAGFVAKGRNFVRESGEERLVLLRFGGSKFANACQFTSFMLCLRHSYLRDVWEKVPKAIPDQISDFPFQIAPSDLCSDAWRSWSYRFELNTTRYDQVEYGGLADATELLSAMGSAVATNGLKWASQFSASASLEMLLGHGQPAFVERLWIQDYRQWLRDARA